MTIKAIDKAVRSEMNSFEMQDVTSGIKRKESVKTGLLQALLAGTSNEFSVTTDKLSHDELVETVQLPEGKRFDEVGGGRVKKDNAREMLYRTGSYGISANVSPMDVAGKRKPFSEEMYTTEERVQEMSTKMDRSWNDFNEIALAKVLTTDTNFVFGGDAKSYDYFADIHGDTRANLGYDAVDLLVGSGADVEKKLNDAVDKMQEECALAGTSYTSLVMPVSGDLYDKLFDYEQTQTAAVAGIDSSTTLDLSILAGDRGGFSADEMVFKRRNFTSVLTGITYIRMADSIGGTSLLGTNAGFLIPAGADNMFATIYSPSMTMDYVNTSGMKRYSFAEEHKRRGITLFEESNNLYMNRNPKLVQKFVSSN
jgi:hypothetical protein